MVRKMWFKIGVSRDVDGRHQSEYLVRSLEADGMLADLPPAYFEDNVSELFGLREDQDGYDQVHDYASLCSVLQDQEHTHTHTPVTARGICGTGDC